MGFEFAWDDDSHKTMRYSAEGDWNWKDYHLCVRQSMFSLHGSPHDVDSIIDLRGSTRETMPSGLPAHVRTFGKKLHERFSGRAVVIGMPADAVASLDVDDSGILSFPGGEIHFVDSDEEAQAVITAWQAVGEK